MRDSLLGLLDDQGVQRLRRLNLRAVQNLTELKDLARARAGLQSLDG